MKTHIDSGDDFEVYAVLTPEASGDDAHVAISTCVVTDGSGEYRPNHHIRVHVWKVDDFIRALRAAAASTRALVALREEAYG